MRSCWHKMKKTSQSESTVKTPPPSSSSSSQLTTKRSHLTSFMNQVSKLFSSSHTKQPEKDKPNNFFVLPSISVTTPEGQTTAVE